MIENNYKLEVAYGPEIERHIPSIAQLRMEVFKEFPYLYNGDMQYESKYLFRYAQSRHSMVALAYSGEQLIGASTAMPLKDEEKGIRDPVLDFGWDVESIMYFGESIVLAQHRGSGFGKKFFSLREEHAKNCDLRIKKSLFCSVIRDKNHPKRPVHYKPLNDFWTRIGYQPAPNLKMSLSWKEVGEPTESRKELQVWVKDLT